MVSPKTNGNIAPSPKQPKYSTLVQLIWRLFEISYGWLVLMVFAFQMFRLNKKFRVMDKNDKKDLAAARSRLWGLQTQPFGLSHKFCELRDGTRLHYVLSRPDEEVKGKNGLVVFLHGFPDSWHIWQSLLRKANLSENATLVAVDLPGFGGSDGLSTYDPTFVLEAIAEFIIKMRETYLTPGDSGREPVIVVGHDWGTVIGFRLASEAPILADRFILSNAIHPLHARANIERRLTATAQILKTWIHNPTNFRLLRRVYPNLKPIISQLSKSGYVFTFRLPWPLSSILGSFGDFWFFRLLNAFAGNHKPTEPVPGNYGWDLLASSLGPSRNEVKSAGANGHLEKKGSALSEPLVYPHSVKGRAASGGWSTKIRLYQDGLAFQPWTKSLQILWELNQLEQSSASLSSVSSGASSGRQRSGSLAPLFNMGPPGTLFAPVTVLWGQKDVAINDTIALDGMSDYFGARGSHVICLPRAGHWTTSDKQAIDVWEKVIHWAITGEKASMKELIESYPAANLTVAF